MDKQLIHGVTVNRLRRVFNGFPFSIPAYYVSVAARNLGARKERWARERVEGKKYPEILIWDSPNFDDPRAGLIAKVGSSGELTELIQSEPANGMLLCDGRVLSAQHDAMQSYSSDLQQSQIFASFPVWNDLHTLRESPKGILVTSSGTDSITEISRDGKQILWLWWAGEHGYTTDSFGKKRTLDRQLDHRHFLYNTWLRTTHVNSAQPLSDGSVLASFFHQGILGCINRETGTVTTIVADLKRPHAARISDGKVSFADTGRGIAYLGTLKGDRFVTENSVQIETNWLQDAQFVNGMWFLADAQHARIYFANKGGEVLAYDQFDPEWDFFEVLPYRED
ncbi:MAG: hypothetical protein AAB421_00395 [Patescibacteria group bacterium]